MYKVNTAYKDGESLNSAELGKRIREARLAKKMTQSEVVGTFITRNMLSQIESGIATPSLQTLEYLANVLEIPPSSLMAEPKTDAPQQLSQLLSAKEAFKCGEYQKAIKMIGEPQMDIELFDELCLLLSKCHCALGDTDKAEYYISQSIYK